MITCVFTELTDGYDAELGTWDFPEVPRAGESITYKNVAYRVWSRAWKIRDEQGMLAPSLIAYVRLERMFPKQV